MAYVFSVGFFVCFLGVFLGVAYGSGKLASKWFRIPDYRLFDVGNRCNWPQRTMIQMSSLAGPYLLVSVLSVGAHLALGTTARTNGIEPTFGPALAAGLKSGDRILSVDGTLTRDFEAVRNALHVSKPVHKLSVARQGEILTVHVAPDERGLIGIRAMEERVNISMGEAIGKSIKFQLDTWKAAISLGQKKAELMGPVGIVADVDRPPHRSIWVRAVPLLFIGWLLLLFVAFGQVFAWVTSVVFVRLQRLSVPLLDASPLPLLRERRRRQALIVAVVATLLLVFLQLFADVSFTRIPLVDTLQGAFAAQVLVLVWLLLRTLHGRATAIALTALFLVPVAGWIGVIGYVLWATRHRVRTEAARAFG